MKIKSYNSFILENFNGFDSLAEYIEYLAKDDDYAKSVISEFTKGFDPSVRISNAVNTLDKHTQGVILKMIKNKHKPAEQVDVTPSTYIRFDESNQVGGKNIFKCFLKVVSALGQKDCEINWQLVPDEFICCFITESINIDQVKNVMSRYLYFDKFLSVNSDQSNSVKLYFGMKTDFNLEYGIIIDNRFLNLGQFLITQGTYNYIMTMDLKSAQNLKKFIVSFDLNKLSLLSKIKLAMKDYFPGQSDGKMKPFIQNEVISYGFQGLGKWDNNKLDEGELENIKNNFRQFISQYKWSDSIQFNVVPTDSWIFVNLKIK